MNRQEIILKIEVIRPEKLPHKEQNRKVEATHQEYQHLKEVNHKGKIQLQEITIQGFKIKVFLLVKHGFYSRVFFIT